MAQGPRVRATSRSETQVGRQGQGGAGNGGDDADHVHGSGVSSYWRTTLRNMICHGSVCGVRMKADNFGFSSGQSKKTVYSKKGSLFNLEEGERAGETNSGNINSKQIRKIGKSQHSKWDRLHCENAKLGYIKQ